MQVKKTSAEWKIYRTRFLVKARQLTDPLIFVDALGREHCGQAGDYLVESSDGGWRIAPQEIFEDVYIAMGPAAEPLPSSWGRALPSPPSKQRISSRLVSTAQARGDIDLWKSGLKSGHLHS